MATIDEILKQQAFQQLLDWLMMGNVDGGSPTAGWGDNWRNATPYPPFDPTNAIGQYEASLQPPLPDNVGWGVRWRNGLPSTGFDVTNAIGQYEAANRPPSEPTAGWGDRWRAATVPSELNVIDGIDQYVADNRNVTAGWGDRWKAAENAAPFDVTNAIGQYVEAQRIAADLERQKANIAREADLASRRPDVVVRPTSGTGVAPARPTGPSGPVPSTTGMPRRNEVANANAFEERLGGFDRGKNVGSQVNETYIPDTGTGTVDAGLAAVAAALGLNLDGSSRNDNNNGAGGVARVVLSPEQIQSMVDTLGQQTMMAGQGIGQAYDQANREMAQLMRQYSRAEKMNRAGAQGTLSAFGAPKSAYNVGDFGAPEMLAGARANLIGGKAAEMSNWSNQQALYKQLLKDMGG